MLVKGSPAERKAPCNKVIAHVLEHADPAIRGGDAGIDRIEVEQAHAKTGGETHEGETCQQVKGIKPWVGWWDGHVHVNLYRKWEAYL